MGKKADEQAKPKRQTQLEAALKIGALGGIFGAALLTSVLVVTHVSVWSEPTPGEFGAVLFPLAIVLTLIGIPLGVVGRLLSVLFQFQIYGAVRGAVFGAIVGLIFIATIFKIAMPHSELFFPVVGLWAGYIIAGALIGSKLKREMRSNILTS